MRILAKGTYVDAEMQLATQLAKSSRLKESYSRLKKDLLFHTGSVVAFIQRWTIGSSILEYENQLNWEFTRFMPLDLNLIAPKSK